MVDPLLVASTADLPHESRLGLRQRHQANLRHVPSIGDDEVMHSAGGSGTSMNSPNRNGNIPQDPRTEISSPQMSAALNNNRSDDSDEENDNTAFEGRPTPATTLFMPLSRSTGIGVLRISRLYCFVSIVTALIAIISAPIPTYRINYNNLVTMTSNVLEGNRVLLKNNAMKSATLDDEKGQSNSGGKNNSFSSNVIKFIVTNLKPWSIEESIADIFSERKKIFSSTPTDDNSMIGKEKRYTYNTRVPLSRSRKLIDKVNSLLEDKLPGFIKQKKFIKNAEQRVWLTDSISDEKTSYRIQEHERNSIHNYSGSEERGENDTLKQTIKLCKELQWIDQIFWEGDSCSDIVTTVIDKILKSTIRLCIITNFMLTMTYLLHSAVAAWFLSHSAASSYGSDVTTAMQGQNDADIGENSFRILSELSFASSSGATGARERMGGFLIFKLLLISAVLAPDTLDLMILVTWFTLLGCLRSVDHLAHSTNTHLTTMGQPPKKGVVQILCWVFSCNIVAAGFCAALFHTAGYGMVLLLTCDCALLGADVISHILNYYQSVSEYSHNNLIRDLEELQLNLNRATEDENLRNTSNHEEESEEMYVFDEDSGNQEQPSSGIANMSPTDFSEESSRLDHEMEELELAHSRRISILDTTIFSLDMTCHILTIAHFCQIWAFYGIQFTLIDGVLALHLHSAIATACAKLARRRNIHKITRDLEEHFSNVTDEELKQASIDGDVCCICLGSMTKGVNVKKAPCGHIYHTQCLREVIERAHTLQSAKCPLCRAPLLDNHLSTTDVSSRNGIDDNDNLENNNSGGSRVLARLPVNPAIDSEIGNDNLDDIVQAQHVEGERALFRFSTDGTLPMWLPVPAFSFEVVRRQPLGSQAGVQSHNRQIGNAATTNATRSPTRTADPIIVNSRSHDGENTDIRNENEPVAPPYQHHQDTHVTLFRRFLLFTGLIPMTAEEEAQALTHLVDMFPQYDRSDLLQELRNRGSLEAVTEAILIGIFAGNPRAH